MKIIKNWWHGEEYHLDGVYPGTRYKRHWSSEWLHKIVNHCFKYRNKYYFGIVTAILSAVAAKIIL